MSDNISSLLSSGGATWNLPPGEGVRQAIPALRGYAYQLHRSLAAWIALPVGATLHLEVAEDYASLVQDPAKREEILRATQIKETRESGAVTLNSADALDAVQHLWALQEENRGRSVYLDFLTTSPIGKERVKPLPSGATGLQAWYRGARGGAVDEIRQALIERLSHNTGFAEFLATADDDALRERLLRKLTWICGEPPFTEIEDDNRLAIVELGHTVGGTPDLSARAADILLVKILSTILTSSDRKLTRGDLLLTLEQAVTVRVPAQAASASLAQSAAAPGIRGSTVDLVATGAWRSFAPTAGGQRASRPTAVAQHRSLLADHGSLWLHGATGLGKTTLAELIGWAYGGEWHVLDLRGVTPVVATERLVSARATVVALPDLAGLIIDDLPTEQELALEGPLARLNASLDRRNAVCIVTSHNPPSRRLVRALGAPAVVIRAAPAFDECDTGALVAAYGGDPARWAKFVWTVGGFGHPQLVDAVIAGLAGRGWPDDEMRRWLDTGLRNDDVEAERDTVRRRLIEELAPETRQFLCRTARIVGSFDRELALAVGRASPELLDCGASLDRLTGHWIERLGSLRLRASPLVSGLDRQLLSAGELSTVDRAIAESIIRRRSCDADLMDTAFVHAMVGGARDVLLLIAYHISQAEHRDRVLLASAMPLFRSSGSELSGLLGSSPFLAVLLRLAQHHLIAAIGDAGQIATSAKALVDSLDRVDDATLGLSLEGMVLSKILLDDFTFGKIPNWADLVERLDVVAQQSPLIGEMAAKVATEGLGPVEFAFLAHAIQLPGIAALVDLFEDLDRLEPSARLHRLAPLKRDTTALSLVVDNAWLKQSHLGVMDGRSQAAVFAHLGDMALAWPEPGLAAKCFRAGALMLDEYANDREAALAALDRADACIPDSLDLRRERAKIAWRAKDYKSALAELTAIADRLESSEPLDTAFALREAAVSAGELGQWDVSCGFFVRANKAAVRATDAPNPFSIGLAIDAAAAGFGSGDRVGSVRAMAAVLNDVTALDPQADRKTRYCHLLARHIVLWMQSHFEPNLTVGDGGPVIYIPGAASNPAPLPAIDGRRVSPLSTAWLLLGRVALQVGMLADEVLAWPGIADVRKVAVLDVELRMSLLESAIEQKSVSAFCTHLVSAIEGLRYIASSDWRHNPPDPFALTASDIPPLSHEAFKEPVTRAAIRDATLAMAARMVFPERALAVELAPLHVAINDLMGYDVMPEWSEKTDNEEKDIVDTVARLLRILSRGQPATVEDLFLAHLRLLEWLSNTNYRRILAKYLAERVRQDWRAVIESRRGFLLDPDHTVPPLLSALQHKRVGEVYAAGVLLAAEPAVTIQMSESYRDRLLQMLLRGAADRSTNEPRPN